MELKKKCKHVIQNWINAEDGSGEYKMTGRYWEVLYPILAKYAPIELAEYEGKIGQFDYFNEEVRKLVDTGDEEENFNHAIRWMNFKEDLGSGNNDIDYIDLGDDNIIAYLPNQNIDQDQHFGRDNK